MDNKPIYNLQPSYTDIRFAHAQTVWIEKGRKLAKDGEYVKGANYEYNDRLWQWNWEKANQAGKVIDVSLDRRSPAYIQEFLRYYYDNQTIELVHVMAGFNVSNGYPYQVYGYIKK